MRFARTSLALAVGLAVSLLPASPAAAATPPPNSMASMGDSITRGFNASGWFSDSPSRSFSTGTDSVVNSHYLRILAKNPAISGRNFNDARSGAKATDMSGQAGTAVGPRRRVRDDPDRRQRRLHQQRIHDDHGEHFPVANRLGAQPLKTGLPNAQVALMSVPDIYRLWSVGKVSSSARSAWGLFGICQSMLANPTSTAQTDVDRRARVRQRVDRLQYPAAQACVAYGAQLRLRRQRRLQLPVRALAGEHVGLLPPQPQRPGGARKCQLRGHLQLV
jgi:hypothetical protein